MTNYKIEGNINFYEELYKSLDDKSEESENTTLELCLITNMPLKEGHIVLGCNHKFNYDAIYNDILNHKKKYNLMERRAIKSHEIRCPYCRTIHQNLLPQRDGYKKVHGVNHFDEVQETLSKINHSHPEYIQGECKYLGPSENTENIPYKCNNKYVKLLQLDGKHYCIMHHHTVLCKIIKETKIKEKENKIKEKEEKKAAVLLAKNKLKEEKLLLKLAKLEKLAKNPKSENVILSSSTTNGCSQILKSGINKGSPCGNKICQDGLCGRHYKSQNSEIK